MPDILIISRSTLYSQPGGDTVQIEQTAAELRRLGFRVDIKAGSNNLKPEDYDLVHFFNLTRPADLLRYLPWITRLITTSIYVDYSESEKQQAGTVRFLIRYLLGKHGTEYLKTIMRWLSGTDRFPGWQYLVLGQRASVKKILQASECIITASKFEQQMISDDFPGLAAQFQTISLGSEHFVPEDSVKRNMAVACVARIESLKNQLGLIRAQKKTEHTLDLYGMAARNQKKYLRACEREGIGKVNFKGQRTHEELQKLLPAYAVHALPSYFETTGLSSLEALASGCQIVVSEHPIQKELFGEHAHYCEPGNPDSIAQAVNRALNSKNDHRSWVREKFSWQKAAKEISDIYLNRSA